MKVLTWVLVVFSGLAIVGILFKSNPDSSSVMGLAFGGLVMAQGIMVLNHLSKEKNIN